MQWQIVIPMSGFGERFRRAGYTIPKPLISVDGKPIVGHVLDLFPNETDVHCICNREHLAQPDWDMRGALERLRPGVKIHAIAPHKLGPVNAAAQILEHLDPARPVAVSYCDFGGRWDWPAFKAFMAESTCDGAVISYTGFHPHMLSCTRYAYSKLDASGRVTDIQEKAPYTDTPMQEWASCGIYCFASGALLAEAVRATLDREDLKLNGEYYMSLAYRPLLERGADIRVFPLEQFCQWGTPEDLARWKNQVAAVRRGATPQERPAMPGATMLPMAGLGSRFAREGYTTPKPLIPVMGRPMALAAWQDMPQTPQNVFILRRAMPGADQVAESVGEAVSGAVLHRLDGETDGQARTCLLGLEHIDPDVPLTIAACDNGLRYDAGTFAALWAQGPDVVVWTVRGYPGAVQRPEQYGWVDATAGGAVRGVSVKKPLADPEHAPVVTGAFTFRRAGDFRRAAERMIAREGRINGEYYVDECINDALALGLDVRIFDVEAYLCWGTPDDLKTWEYWRRYDSVPS